MQSTSRSNDTPDGQKGNLKKMLRVITRDVQIFNENYHSLHKKQNKKKRPKKYA